MLLSHQTKDFDFSLPKELVAIHPVSPRDHSRLLYVYNSHMVEDLHFFDLPKKLHAGDVLIFNDVKVMPSQLICVILNEHSSICSEDIKVNLTKKINNNTWQLVGKPSKKLQKGNILYFKKFRHNIENNTHPKQSQNTKSSQKRTSEECDLFGKVTDKNEMFIEVQFNIAGDRLVQKFCELGDIPLPQYLGRAAEISDAINYQTVYANKIGAMAAPTAGLHFTDEMLKILYRLGVQYISLTLYVGGGTFLPIKVNNIAEHKMHTEWFELTHTAIEDIARAKAEKRRIICVGTTSLRAVESIADIILSKRFNSAQNENRPKTSLQHKDGSNLNDVYFNETNIFITPGYKFKIVDALITNFHLPKSTLFVLVCAILGKSRAHKIYQYAISKRYRFFSYGDACFLKI